MAREIDEQPKDDFDPRYFTSREVCPVCETPGGTLLYRAPLSEPPLRSMLENHYSAAKGTIEWSYLEGTDYVLLECQSCGLIYQKYVPNGFMLNHVYNEMIDSDFLKSYEERALTLRNFENISGELEALFALIRKPLSEITFLDYGFGFGKWSRAARGMGATVFATEISPEKIIFAREVGVQIIDNDAISAMKFDIVHAEQVAEHLVEPLKDVALLAGATAEGGIFKMAVPRPGNIKALLASRGMIERSPQEHLLKENEFLKDAGAADYVGIMPLEHVNLYTDRTAEFMAKRFGLTIESTARPRVPRVHVEGFGSIARSLANVAKEALKPIIERQRKDRGYYLFRK